MLGEPPRLESRGFLEALRHYEVCYLKEKINLGVFDGKNNLIAILISYWEDNNPKIGIYYEHIFIRRICVNRRYRRKGIAKSMIFHLIHILPKKSVIVLQTDSENIPANELYKCLKFDIVSKVDMGNHEDVVWVKEC